jgi:hypothetical protein
MLCMSIELLTDRYSKQIAGVISCYDRIVILGTLPKICFAEGMTSFLYQNKTRIFDYPKFAEPFRDQIRDNAEKLASDHGIEIEFIRKKNFRKEDRIKEVLKQRGESPGLVWIFSAMEPCATFKPWHDKNTGKTFLKSDQSKCLHYYFYFIDDELGLCYVRVPTWLPCRLQVYCNGHNWLALQMARKGIAYKQLDNAFTEISSWSSAQTLSDSWQASRLHKRLDYFAQRFCPIFKYFDVVYHWSLNQAEYSTDIVFKKQADLAAIYDQLTRTAIHAIKADNIATFLGRKLHGNYQDEMGNRYNVRIEGTRIKHSMGPVSIKMYDKFSLILRIETTVNDVSFFKHYREVEHRDGSKETKWAPMQKTIYSMPALRELLAASNRRYLEFISTIEDPRSGNDKLSKLSHPVRENDRSFPGFNFFDSEDQVLFETISICIGTKVFTPALPDSCNQRAYGLPQSNPCKISVIRGVLFLFAQGVSPTSTYTSQ